MHKVSITFTVVLIALVSAGIAMAGTNATYQKTSLLQASIDRGQKVYYDRCLTCHQVDGGGVQNMNPPLIKTKYVLGDKTQLITVVLKGLQGNIDIEGDIYHNVMPANPDLTDQQIADVLTFVRNSFGNKAKSVSTAEVKAVRAKLK
jgi:mono/diheme cytochrome c family protein